LDDEGGRDLDAATLAYEFARANPRQRDRARLCAVPLREPDLGS
jgi:hypothetical protein